MAEPARRLATYEDILALPEHMTGEIIGDLAGWRCERLKAPTYARHGVQHLWLTDPIAGHVDAYALREDGWLWLGSWSDNDARISPFDAIGIALRYIWELVGGPKSEP